MADGGKYLPRKLTPEEVRRNDERHRMYRQQQIDQMLKDCLDG